jgi:hypothetical protein
VHEKGSAGARYSQGCRGIAGTIGRRLRVPVVSKTPEEAGNHFGWFAPLGSNRQPGIESAIPDIDRRAIFKSER